MSSPCSQKHLGLLLDECLNFNEKIQRKKNKCYKIIGGIRKLSSDLARDALLRIIKSFVWPIIPCQWKTKSPWLPLSDRSLNYNLWCEGTLSLLNAVWFKWV